MPKMKTHKGIKKRVKVTARGKIKYYRSGSRHLMAGKSAKRKRRLKRPGILEGTLAAKMLRLIGGGA